MKLNILFAVLYSASSLASAEIPAEIQHQGRIAVDGVNFNGNGQFKFLLYHGNTPGDIAIPLWKNNASNPPNGKEPASAVSVPVTKGLYSIELGGAPQQPITSSLVPTAPRNLYLRIWFNDGVNGFQLLSPDKKFSSAAFARHSDLSGNNVSELNNDAGFLSGNSDVTLNGSLSVLGKAAFGTGANAAATDAIAWGTNATASGITSTAWGSLTDAKGTLSTASGLGTVAESAMETVLGRYDTNYTPASASAWNVADRLFVIGKGINNANRADALVMLKSGDTTLNGKFTVNNDILTSGSFKYNSAKTFKVQIAGSEFTPGTLTATGANDGLMRFSSSSSQHTHMVQSKLPPGATVTKVTLRYFEDSSDGTGMINKVTATLRKRSLALTDPTNSTLMASFNETNTGPWTRSYETSAITNALVSENDVVYFTVTTIVSNTLNIGIAGMTIEYTTNTVTQ